MAPLFLRRVYQKAPSVIRLGPLARKYILGHIERQSIVVWLRVVTLPPLVY